MERQSSEIIIYQRAGAYYADVPGCYGGGYSGAKAGDTAEAAALYALRERARYIATNPLGGQMYLPAEVRVALEAARAG